MQQPWLTESPEAPGPTGRPDDFSHASPTLPLRRVCLGLVPVFLLLLMGRSAQLVDALYGLPVLPGTEALIAVAEWWHGAMQAIGVAGAMEALKEVLRAGL